jgi:hypothetical protein
MREAAEVPTPVDTVTVGPLRIVTTPDEVEPARDLFSEVWLERFPNVSASPSLASRTFVFQWRASYSPLNVQPGPDQQLVGVEISRVWAPTRARAKALVADAIARALVSDFPNRSPMNQWLTLTADPGPELAYRHLASGTNGATGGCLAADVAACMAALGLRLSDSESRLDEWFSPQERREMVGNAALAERVDRDGILYRRCFEENDANACNPLLADLDWVASLPTSDRLRAHLLWFAARVGGEGAWLRALDRVDEPMPEVLASMSGRPLEQLVAEWRADVVANRPNVQAGLGGKGTRALFWSLIFVAFAMRSTRWRLA